MANWNSKHIKSIFGSAAVAVVVLLLIFLFVGKIPETKPEPSIPNQAEQPVMAVTEPSEPVATKDPSAVEADPAPDGTGVEVEPTYDAFPKVTEPMEPTVRPESPNHVPTTDGVPLNPDGTKGQLPVLPGDPGREPAADTPDHAHAYIAQNVAPTCDVMGYTLHICGCGHMYYDGLVDATGHAFAYDSTVEPGSVTEGYMRFLCVRSGCGQELREHIVPPLGPDYDCEAVAAHGRDYAHGLGFTVVMDADISGWYSISQGVYKDSILTPENGQDILQERICALVDMLVAQLSSENPDNFNPGRYIITVKVWFSSSAEHGDVYGLGVYGTIAQQAAEPSPTGPSDGTQDPIEPGIPIEEP